MERRQFLKSAAAAGLAAASPATIAQKAETNQRLPRGRLFLALKTLP
jgi:uncharacterized protein (DUF1501 family)